LDKDVTMSSTEAMTGSAGSADIQDRIMGAYLGAALGDAMGAPVEGWHAQRIREVYGRVETLLPYEPERLKPGYALHPEPGSVTDDTYIRDDITRFVLTYPDAAQRTAEALYAFLMAEARFDRWWQKARIPLQRIERGETTVQDASKAHDQAHDPGGGAGWWTPTGLVWAGYPAKAAEEVRRLSVIWKRPLERQLAGAMQAATAHSVVEGAAVESVVAAARAEAGPLGATLIDRAVETAIRRGDDLDGLIAEIYDRLLIHDECTDEIDGPTPPASRAQEPHERKVWSYFAEQLPVTLAMLVYGKGDLRRTMIGVVNLGLDADSTSTSVGTWIGGLCGLAGIPREWVDTVVGANPELDLLGDARRLAKLAAA
jgi:ADP-ribosylglycohydrolase